MSEIGSLSKTNLNEMASTAMERLAGMTIFNESCPGHQALALLGSKWSVLLLYAMSQGAKRYGDLQRIMPDISTKMFTDAERTRTARLCRSNQLCGKTTSG